VAIITILSITRNRRNSFQGTLRKRTRKAVLNSLTFRTDKGREIVLLCSSNMNAEKVICPRFLLIKFFRFSKDSLMFWNALKLLLFRCWSSGFIHSVKSAAVNRIFERTYFLLLQSTNACGDSRLYRNKG